MKKHFLYYLPFLLFALTYIYLIYYYQRERILVPQLIGTLLGDLMLQYSEDLIFKIVKVTYNKEYEDGYIVGQYPLANSLIRRNQVISLEVNNNRNKSIKNLLYKNNYKNLDIIKENYKKEGIAYKIINFNNFDDSLKKITTVYDKNKNITYIYVVPENDTLSLYIKNLSDCSCLSISDFNEINCYTLDNIMVENCSGCQIKSQFPLPGVYEKNNNKIRIHIWH